jgi:hypothetical protein
VIAVLAATACGQKPTASPDFAAQRQLMVQQQLVPRGIKDGRVLAAMTKVPREEFVPPGGKAGVKSQHLTFSLSRERHSFQNIGSGCFDLSCIDTL